MVPHSMRRTALETIPELWVLDYEGNKPGLVGFSVQYARQHVPLICRGSLWCGSSIHYSYRPTRYNASVGLGPSPSSSVFLLPSLLTSFFHCFLYALLLCGIRLLFLFSFRIHLFCFLFPQYMLVYELVNIVNGYYDSRSAIVSPQRKKEKKNNTTQ